MLDKRPAKKIIEPQETAICFLCLAAIAGCAFFAAKILGDFTTEATPFCKSLCLKTDVLDWNMTCEDRRKRLNGCRWLRMDPRASTKWGQTLQDMFWLVVWNHGFFWLSIQLGRKHHPNWRSPSFFNIFQRGRAQPPTSDTAPSIS